MKNTVLLVAIFAAVVFCGLLSFNHTWHGHGEHHGDDVPSGYHKMDDGTLMKTSENHETTDKTHEEENETNNPIIIHSLLEIDLITSPVTIDGEAAGNWFFEGSFPIVIVDWDGKILGEGIAQAEREWMTEDHVPFTATITFEKPTYKNTGAFIFKKDNPSGLPQNDATIEIPVTFAP